MRLGRLALVASLLSVLSEACSRDPLPAVPVVYLDGGAPADLSAVDGAVDLSVPTILEDLALPAKPDFAVPPPDIAVSGDLAGDPCFDGARDGRETDVDCGGGVCRACLPARSCRVDGDCTTGSCYAGRCARHLDFRMAPSFSSPGSGFVGAAADFTGDGRPDLVLASREVAGPFHLAVNQGGPGGQGGAYYARPLTVPVVLDQSLVAADLDGDGKADVAGLYAWANSYNVTIVRGDGRGGFGAPATVRLGARPVDLAALDADGDGDLDLVVSLVLTNNTRPSMTFLRNLGAKGFAIDGAYTVSSDPRDLHVADLDGDRRLDVVAVTSNAEVAVYLGNGDGTFQPARYVPGGGKAGYGRVALGDLDGDKVPDLAIPSANSGELFLLRGDGKGGFGASALVATLPGPIIAAVAGDLDGDGRLDLLMDNSYQFIVVLRGAGNGRFEAPRRYAAEQGPHSLIPVDVDGDGRVDVVAANGGVPTVSVLRSLGGGELFAASIHGPQTVSLALAAGDFDRDGRVELALPGRQSTVALLQASLAPDWPEATLLVPFPALGLVTTDTNGDGRLDLAATVGQSAGVFLGNGDGTFQPFAGQRYQGLASQLILAGDLDEDGRADLITQSAVLLRNPNGGYRELPESFGLDSLIGDLDGDAHLDVISGDFGGGVVFRKGDGKGRFGPAVPVPAIGGAAIRNVGALGDLDGDGHLDLVTVEDSSLGVYLTAGRGQLGKGTLYAVPEYCLSPVIADLDGDGRPDVTCRGVQGRTGIAVLRNRGGALDTAVSFGGAGPSQFAGQRPMIAIDYSRDGLDDLLTVSEAGTVAIENLSR